MAKGRVRNRLELREQYEAAEAREQEQRTDDADGAEEAEEAEEEGVAVKKKPKKKAASTEPKPKRSRAAKVIRQRIVWIVFDNSHKPIQTFEYPRRLEAEELAARLATDKKSTYFVQPVKEEVKD